MAAGISNTVTLPIAILPSPSLRSQLLEHQSGRPDVAVGGNIAGDHGCSDRSSAAHAAHSVAGTDEGAADGIGAQMYSILQDLGS